MSTKYVACGEQGYVIGTSVKDLVSLMQLRGEVNFAVYQLCSDGVPLAAFGLLAQAFGTSKKGV